MRFFFHHEAEEEFLKAIDYYEEVHSGLGVDFAIEVYSTIERIVEFPEAWPVIEEDIRRCLTKRFHMEYFIALNQPGLLYYR